MTEARPFGARRTACSLYGTGYSRLLRSDGIGPYAISADTKPVQNPAWASFAANVFVDNKNPPLYVDYYLV